MSMISNSSNTVEFDWLEKTTSPRMEHRVSQALTFSAKRNTSQNKIFGREVDQWVPENQELRSLFAKLYPLKSKGGFFPRVSHSNGEGRLQFVEWFQSLIKRNKSQHIAIFDPYFEDVGLSLLTLYARPSSEYTIFRSKQKPNQEDTSQQMGTGVHNLIANCEQHRRLLERNKLKIYGLKDGRLHDRYILVIGENGLPVEGFHLSNSFQKAAESYPLLITPIPMDVLYKTKQYLFDLLQMANMASNGVLDENIITLLFDSKETSDNMVLSLIHI